MIQIDKSDSRLCIRIPWRILRQRTAAIAAALFAVALAYVASTDGQFQGIFRSLIGLAAAGSAYYSATHFANWTELVLDEEYLRVTHGPLPIRLPARLARPAIARFVASASRRLEARTTQGEHIVLLEALPADALDQLQALLAEHMSS